MLVLVGQVRTETQLYQFDSFQKRHLPSDDKKPKIHRDHNGHAFAKWKQMLGRTTASYTALFHSEPL